LDDPQRTADRFLSEGQYERLQRLEQLLDAGVISAEEFEREKREVLGP